MNTSFNAERLYVPQGNTYGGRHVSWDQQRFPSLESGVRALPNFGVILYLCLHPLTQNDQIGHGNTYGGRACFNAVSHARHPSGPQFCRSSATYAHTV